MAIRIMSTWWYPRNGINPALWLAGSPAPGHELRTLNTNIKSHGCHLECLIWNSFFWSAKLHLSVLRSPEGR